MEPQQTIRPTVRAVIRRGPFVLVQVKQRPSGRCYLTLPGGRQEVGETMQDCLVRECMEEIGVAPHVRDVLHVADVLRSGPDKSRHLSEILFECTVPQDYEAQMGTKPDKRQIGTIWVNPPDRAEAFFPRYDLALTRSDAPIYLGRLTCGTS